MAAAEVHLHRPQLLPLLLRFLLGVSCFSPPLPLAASADAPPQSAGLSEGKALLAFKDALGNPAVLSSSWIDGGEPCGGRKGTPWVGVVCSDGLVTGIRLHGMGLSGVVNRTAIEGLGRISGLRSISLSDNSFSGEIPPLAYLVALKSIFLSNNNFSGTIEDGFFSGMTHMKKVWLSGNGFGGEIPSSLSKLTHLMELHLEDNQFTGRIPAMNLPSLKSINVSNNKLEGPIPAGLERFEASSFRGNSGLCGEKFGGRPCATAPGNGKEAPSGKKMLVSVVLSMLLLALVAGLAVVKKRRGEVFDTLGVENAEADSLSVGMAAAGGSSHRSHGASCKRGSGSSHGQHDSSRKCSSSRKGSASGSSHGPGELVTVSQEKGVFGLADLMKASAEVLGNGGLGSSYKAVMANGVAVVVKRMRDLNRMGKDGFEAEIRRFSRLRHPNVLTPLAYHYRKEEKLLIYEHVNNGSLLYALHGDRGVHHAALDWPTRLKIVQGITRAMVYLHTELASSDVPHGNLKSGNVLLGADYSPLLVDYGFVPLVNPSQAAIALFAYKSPESVHHRQVSPKSDVYSLGVVILEVITGKFPSQYLNNGNGGTDIVEWATCAVAEKRESELVDPAIVVEGAGQPLASMEQLLRVGTACVDSSPERRPDMREAARRVEEIDAEGRRNGDLASAKDGRPELTSRLSVGELAGGGGDGFGVCREGGPES